MARPTPHAFTERLYAALPEVYRDPDAALDYPLLRYLSLMGDLAGTVEDVIDRVDPAREGDLVDVDTADTAWLPWLAQITGLAALPPSLTDTEKRNLIRRAASGRYAGTRQAIADAARPALTDPEGGYVDVRPNYQGNAFTIGVSVDPDSAPADLNTVLAAIIAAGAKPAGYALAIDIYAAMWEQIETLLNTWAGVEAAGTSGSWADVERTGAP